MNYFEQLATYLVETGIVTFFVPFLISFAFFFALFEKLRLSDKKSINAILSFSVSLLIFVFPLVSGINIAVALSYFFAQAFAFLVVLVFGLLAASLFYPDFQERLKQFFTSRGIMVAMIALAIALFVVSGLLNLLFYSFSPYYSSVYGPAAENTQYSTTGPSADETRNVGVLAALLIIFVVIIVISGRLR